MRDITHIVLHCAATPPDMDIGAADIRRWHLSRGWDDIGYHYVIRRNGEVEKGRDEAVIGAHASGHNEHSIGVCWVGGVNEDREPEDNRTDAQRVALGELVDGLRREHNVPTANIIGHRETGARKACPSFDVQEIRDALEARSVTAPTIFESVPDEPQVTHTPFPLRLIIHADGTVETL